MGAKKRKRVPRIKSDIIEDNGLAKTSRAQQGRRGEATTDKNREGRREDDGGIKCNNKRRDSHKGEDTIREDTRSIR